LPDPDDELSPMAKTYREAGPWLEASSMLTGGAVFGLLAGWALDKWMGWNQPWGIIICSALGIVVGFVGFIRAVLKMGKKKK
jgi:ATP synthase protein I